VQKAGSHAGRTQVGPAWHIRLPRLGTSLKIRLARLVLGSGGFCSEGFNLHHHDNGSLHSNLSHLFPQLRTIDGNSSIHLEAQSNLPALNLEHRDLEHALEANGPSNP